MGKITEIVTHYAWDIQLCCYADSEPLPSTRCWVEMATADRPLPVRRFEMDKNLRVLVRDSNLLSIDSQLDEMFACVRWRRCVCVWGDLGLGWANRVLPTGLFTGQHHCQLLLLHQDRMEPTMALNGTILFLKAISIVIEKQREGLPRMSDRLSSRNKLKRWRSKLKSIL